MINILQLQSVIQMIRWSPHSESKLIAIANRSKKVYMIDYKLGTQDLYEYEHVVTSMIWYPRKIGQCLTGFDNGHVVLEKLE